MNNDPIVEEVHKIREQIARECDDDMERIFEYLKQKETERSDRAVHRKKKAAEKLSV
jgi:HPt (histidine-containing phosphotransfer) domain-containing protein